MNIENKHVKRKDGGTRGGRGGGRRTRLPLGGLGGRLPPYTCGERVTQEKKEKGKTKKKRFESRKLC